MMNISQMQELNTQPNYSGPITTADSAVDGRLKVDVNMKKKKIIKKRIKNQHAR